LSIACDRQQIEAARGTWNLQGQVQSAAPHVPRRRTSRGNCARTGAGAAAVCGASRGSRVNRAARPHQHCAPPALQTPNLVLEAQASKYKPAVSRMKTRLNGQCVRGPGEDPTGAGAEREWGVDFEEQGKYWHDTHTPPSRGVTGGVFKDPRDDPAEFVVLFR
jgi:hypothetical protein